MEGKAPLKRFELATNPVARTRLDDFRIGIKEFQKKHPEVLGATVYGSMIKGDKATEDSDIDSFLYIDAETLPFNGGGKLSEEEKIIIEDEYLGEFLLELNISEDDISKYYKHLRPQLLSNEILDNEIKDFTEQYKKYESFKEMFRKIYSAEMSDKDKDELYDKKPKVPLISFNVGGIFHARVGSGVEKYRRMFLEKIMALPDIEISRDIWGSIHAQLSIMEGRLIEGVATRLPSTLEEGLQIYHPALYKKMLDKKTKIE